MKKKFKTALIILITLVVMFLVLVACVGSSEDGESTLSVNDSGDDNSLLTKKTSMFYDYADEYNIDLTYFPERKGVIDWVEYTELQELLDAGVNVREGFSLSSEIINYVETENNSDWVYYGDLKDGKPEGLGIIFEKNDFFEMDEVIVKYIGYFKDGKYHGYGVEFNCPSINDQMYYSLTQNSFLDENRYLLNDIIYEGYYEKGKKHGKGIEVFSNAGGVNLETGHITTLPEEIEYNVIVGEFKKNETKKCVIYGNGEKVFEGDYEDVEEWYYEESSNDENEEVVMSETGIRDNIDRLIIGTLNAQEIVPNAIEIIEITKDESREVYDCFMEIQYDNCNVSATIVLSLQGEFIGTTVKEFFYDKFNKTYYQEFCYAIASITAYHNAAGDNKLWWDIKSIVPIESGMEQNEKYLDGNYVPSANYTFKYDLTGQKFLELSAYLV